MLFSVHICLNEQYNQSTQKKIYIYTSHNAVQLVEKVQNDSFWFWDANWMPFSKLNITRSRYNISQGTTCLNNLSLHYIHTFLNSSQQYIQYNLLFQNPLTPRDWFSFLCPALEGYQRSCGWRSRLTHDRVCVCVSTGICNVSPLTPNG